jgi:hypothetical protein
LDAWILDAWILDAWIEKDGNKAFSTLGEIYYL